MKQDFSVRLSEDTQQKPQRGRPWPRGVSGCPGGAIGLRKRALAEQTSKLEAHHGRPLTPIEQELVGQLVAVKLAKPQSAADRVKVANTVNRLMRALYGHAKANAVADVPSLADLIRGRHA
jgi:hypothetical protein